MTFSSSLYCTSQVRLLLALATTFVVSSCGGGSSTKVPAEPQITMITDAQRVSAAQNTALNNALCSKIAPFYWEVGTSAGTKASGSIGTDFNANTVMNIASASKWIYGAYVAQKRRGLLNATDVTHLTFTSGYTNFSRCAQNDTVASCLASDGNGDFSSANQNKFFYDGGHMQVHAASQMNLGSFANQALAGEIASTLALGASAEQFGYSQPQLAGGVVTSAQVYAGFLQSLLKQSLELSNTLGSQAVCTSTSVCPSTVVSTPFPSNETPKYSIGHWVEDSVVSDGAFSSPGLFGFYPWIDANKNTYGIIARATTLGTTSADPSIQPYTQSMYCGRLIRKAWLTGISR
jgi:hypothetical protein